MYIITNPGLNGFINHLAYDLSSISKIEIADRQRLYDQYYENKKDIQGYLFLASLLDQEMLEFIQEHRNKTKITVYFDQVNQVLYDDIAKISQCIINAGDEYDASNLQAKNTIKLQPMYSEELYKNITETNISEDIICDISNLSQLPEELNKLLYPNTRLKIKLLNNINLRPAQNLGLADFPTMVNLISSCSCYIDVNLIFLLYPLLLDKPTLALANNNLIKKTKIANYDNFNINDSNKSSLPKEELQNFTHKNFITKYLL